MDKLEFDEKLKTIQELREAIKDLEATIKLYASKLPTSCSSLLASTEDRDSSFEAYIKNLDAFQFADQVTSLDQFPGVSSTPAAANPEEAAQKAEEMKKQAFAIQGSAKKIEAYGRNTISNTKKLLSLLAEYDLQANQIYELELDLVQELDSIYDIGNLSKSTK